MRAIAVLQDWKLAQNSCQRYQLKVPNSVRETTCTKPGIGFVKCNTDVTCFNGENKTGFEGEFIHTSIS